MLNLIAAALVAAAPAPAPAQPTDVHAQHQKMGHQMGDRKPGMMAEMKDCCMDMMAKMHGEHAGHKGQGEQHQNHQQ